jgi:hypothetical protein
VITLGELAGELVARALSRPRQEMPWFLVLLTCLGAWVATLLFLWAAAGVLDALSDWAQWGLTSLVFLGAGLGVRRRWDHVFAAQLALGLVLAGWCAGVAAAGQRFDSVGAGALSGVVLAAVLYPACRDAGLRFLLSGSAAGLATAWLRFEWSEQPLLAWNLPVLASAAGAGLLLRRPGASRALLPLGHALAVHLGVAIPVLDLAGGATEPAAWWPSTVGLTVGLGALAWEVLRDVPADLRRQVRAPALVGVALLGLACLPGGPGLLAAIGLLMLGRVSARRSTEVLGLVALPVFLFLYYRDLELSLLVKSGVLTGSGLALLGLRAWLSRREWARGTA